MKTNLFFKIGLIFALCFTTNTFALKNIGKAFQEAKTKLISAEDFLNNAKSGSSSTMKLYRNNYIGAINKDGQTALHLAAQGNNPKTVEALVEPEKDSEKKNDIIKALKHAQITTKTDFDGAMLDFINYKDKSGQTALDIAKAKNQKAVVEVLTKRISELTKKLELQPQQQPPQRTESKQPTTTTTTESTEPQVEPPAANVLETPAITTTETSKHVPEQAKTEIATKTQPPAQAEPTITKTSQTTVTPPETVVSETTQVQPTTTTTTAVEPKAETTATTEPPSVAAPAVETKAEQVTPPVKEVAKKGLFQSFKSGAKEKKEQLKTFVNAGVTKLTKKKKKKEELTPAATQATTTEATATEQETQEVAATPAQAESAQPIAEIKVTSELIVTEILKNQGTEKSDGIATDAKTIVAIRRWLDGLEKQDLLELNTNKQHAITALMIAAHFASEKAVNKIWANFQDFGLNIQNNFDAQDKKGWKVMHHAAYGGDASIINKLLKQKTITENGKHSIFQFRIYPKDAKDPKILTNKNETVLIIALKNKKFGAAEEFLMQVGYLEAFLESIITKGGDLVGNLVSLWPKIFKKKESQESIPQLVQFIDQFDNSGNSALNYAIQLENVNNAISISSKLIKFSNDPKVLAQALLQCVNTNNIKIAKILLKKDPTQLVNHTYKDNDNKTALAIAVDKVKDNNFSMIELLLKSGAPVPQDILTSPQPHSLIVLLLKIYNIMQGRGLEDQDEIKNTLKKLGDSKLDSKVGIPFLINAGVPLAKIKLYYSNIRVSASYIFHLAKNTKNLVKNTFSATTRAATFSGRQVLRAGKWLLDKMIAEN